MQTFWLLVLFIAVVWCFSVLIAWSLNHQNLIETYGKAPFNWRVLGYMFLYLPWLRKLQSERENNGLR